MNKLIKTSILTLLVMFCFVSCDTYKDPTVKHDAIHPLSGEWVVLSNTNTTTSAVTDTKLKISTYGTVNNDRDKMWIWINAATGFRGKVACDPSRLSFGSAMGASEGTSTLSISSKYYQYSVSTGKITINGYNTLSGHKSDLLEFTYTITDTSVTPNTVVTYDLKAFRYTQWPEDVEGL